MNNSRDAEALVKIASNMGTEIANLHVQIAKQQVIIEQLQNENAELKMIKREGEKNGTAKEHKPKH